jgi:hypothetical protein
MHVTHGRGGEGRGGEGRAEAVPYAEPPKETSRDTQYVHGEVNNKPLLAGTLHGVDRENMVLPILDVPVLVHGVTMGVRKVNHLLGRLALGCGRGATTSTLFGLGRRRRLALANATCCVLGLLGPVGGNNVLCVRAADGAAK